jgi:hypothetical protein
MVFLHIAYERVEIVTALHLGEMTMGYYLKKSTKQALIIKEMLHAQRFLVEALERNEPVQGREWNEWRDLLIKGSKQLQETGIDIYKVEEAIATSR